MIDLYDWPTPNVRHRCKPMKARPAVVRGFEACEDLCAGSMDARVKGILLGRTGAADRQPRSAERGKA